MPPELKGEPGEAVEIIIRMNVVQRSEPPEAEDTLEPYALLCLHVKFLFATVAIFLFLLKGNH